MLSDSDFRFCLQQIEGRQRTRDKLPLFATIPGWLYPPRLNLEQCSSERTARFKAGLLSDRHRPLVEEEPIAKSLKPMVLIDGTGGYGVDTFFMSECARETHYYEQNTELASLAEHNFRLAGKAIHCHAEPFSVQALCKLVGVKAGERASDIGADTILYLDPARRDAHGGKVFRLGDCTPDVTDIVHYVQTDMPAVRVLLKLSPMLDFHQAVAQLGGLWDVYVLSVAGEVKELLLQSGGTGLIHAVCLNDSDSFDLSFAPDEETGAQPLYLPTSDSPLPALRYLYEPDAAILKAGAFRLISARYGLVKADPNTHLYLSSSLDPSQSIIRSLPGRVWQVVDTYTRVNDIQHALARANVLARNYVLSADDLRRRLRIKDGGDDYIIGCRLADRPVLLHCRRV